MNDIDWSLADPSFLWPEDPVPSPPPPPVQVRPPLRGLRLRLEHLRAVGLVRADNSIAVAPRVTGTVDWHVYWPRLERYCQGVSLATSWRLRAKYYNALALLRHPRPRPKLLRVKRRLALPRITYDIRRDEPWITPHSQ